MISKKRIMKEIYTYRSGNYNNLIKEPKNTFFLDSNSEDTIEFMNVYDDDKIVKITLIFKNTTYPFQPPLIKINNMYIGSFLKINNTLLKKYGKYIDFFYTCSCPCCNIPFLKNWNPRYTSSNLLNQIDDALKIKKRVINMIIVKNIMKKKLGFIIPNMFYFI